MAYLPSWQPAGKSGWLTGHSEKGLSKAKRKSVTTYIEDLAEFVYMLLATTQMAFDIG